jgi:RNA-directed DNA polymerase
MRELKIPKKNGSFRVVVCPTRDEKKRLRALLPRLAAAERRLAELRGVAQVAHGFVTGRSPVTNAEAHIGAWLATISMDLSGWFDTIRRDQIAAALLAVGEDPALAERVTVDGVARQGLPTSPIAANLAGVALDVDLIARLDRLGIAYRYTRYADDLTVSIMSDDRACIDRVIVCATEAAIAQGWAISARKTHVYYARAGRRIVTGVAVGARQIYPTREVRRRLRAGRHRRPNAPETRGLAEWARLRPPRAQERRMIRGHAPSAVATEPAPAPIVAPARTGAEVARVIRWKGKGGVE